MCGQLHVVCKLPRTITAGSLKVSCQMAAALCCGGASGLCTAGWQVWEAGVLQTTYSMNRQTAPQAGHWQMKRADEACMVAAQSPLPTNLQSCQR